MSTTSKTFYVKTQNFCVLEDSEWKRNTYSSQLIKITEIDYAENNFEKNPEIADTITRI